MQRKTGATAGHSTQRDRGNPKERSLGHRKPFKTLAQGRRLGFVKVCLWAGFCTGSAVELQGWSRSRSKAPTLNCGQIRHAFHLRDMGTFTPAPSQGLISGGSFCIHPPFTQGTNLSLHQAVISSFTESCLTPSPTWKEWLSIDCFTHRLPKYIQTFRRNALLQRRNIQK